MITTYILILTFSAWLLAHALVLVSGRIVPVLGLYTPKSLVALGVAIAMLTVVEAPAFVLLAAIATAFLPIKRLHLDLGLPTELPWFITLGLLLVLAAAPLAQAPGYFAIDAAIMAASLLGILTVSPGLPVLGRAFPAYLVLILGIVLKLIITHGLHAA